MRSTFWAVVFMLVLHAGVGEARNIVVRYVDEFRPGVYDSATVVMGIQRALREWEANNLNSQVIFHWGGTHLTLSSVPSAGYSQIVIRWVPPDYTSFRGYSCRFYECYDYSFPMPRNHIVLASYRMDPVDGTTTANSPIWRFGDPDFRDIISVLMHELGHLLGNVGDSGHAPSSVLTAPAVFQQRYLWNREFLDGVDASLYNSHTRAHQFFSVLAGNDMGVLSHYVPTNPIRSSVAVAVGDGVGTTGGYILANATNAPINTLVVKLADGRGTEVPRVFGPLTPNVGYTFHRPCVAVSSSGHDYYLAWTSNVEAADGGRAIWAMESHQSGAFLNSWSAPEQVGVADPNVRTRTGLSCAIDRVTERLVLAFTGMDESIWLTHRPSLTPGAGQWSAATQVSVQVAGRAASTYGPVDIAFDFFNAAVPGILTWQDNGDLLTHSASVHFGTGSYLVGTTRHDVHTNNPAALRSWPVVSFEETPVLGVSVFDTTGLPSTPRFGEERWSFPGASPFFLASESYEVGAIHAARRYTGAASNRIYYERAFLSTAIIAQ